MANNSEGFSLLNMISRIFAPAIFFFVFMEAASVLCISKAIDAEGKRIYNPATVVMIQEILKLLVSLVGLWSEDPQYKKFRSNLSLGMVLKSSIPAALYAVNNNIFLIVLTMIHPSIFQLMLNMRVVWTGLIFKFFLSRPVTKKQWLALFILVIGCTIAQTVTSTQTVDTDNDPSIESFSDFIAAIDPTILMGFILTIIYTVVSTTAGVVNEVVLKSGESFHSSNVKLYFFGVIFNLVALFIQGSSVEGGFFRGWEHPIVWVICCLMATIGMLVAKIMQKYDNIVKIFCVAVCNFVVYAYSVVMDNNPVSIGFIIAFVLVSASAYMYQTEKNRLDAESTIHLGDTASSSIYAKVNSHDEFEDGNLEDDDFEDSDFDGAMQGMQLTIVAPEKK